MGKPQRWFSTLLSFNSAHLVSLGVPADLEDAPGSLVRVHQLPVLCAPDVDTPGRIEIIGQMWTHRLDNIEIIGQSKSLLVKTAAGEELPIGGERHTVHWLLVPG